MSDIHAYMIYVNYIVLIVSICMIFYYKIMMHDFY